MSTKKKSTLMFIVFMVCFASWGGATEPNAIIVYDTNGFEAYTLGDISGQSLWYKPYGQPVEAGEIIDISSIGGKHSGHGKVLSFGQRSSGISELILDLDWVGEFDPNNGGTPLPRNVNIKWEFDFYIQGTYGTGSLIPGAIESRRNDDVVEQADIVPGPSFGTRMREDGPDASPWMWHVLKDSAYDMTPANAKWHHVEVIQFMPQDADPIKSQRVRVWLDGEEIGISHTYYSIWAPYQGFIDWIHFYAVEVSDSDPDNQYYIDNLRVIQDFFLAEECGDWGYYPGDVNKDCGVNMLDIAVTAEYWLECSVPSDNNCWDYRQYP